MINEMTLNFKDNESELNEMNEYQLNEYKFNELIATFNGLKGVKSDYKLSDNIDSDINSSDIKVESHVFKFNVVRRIWLNLYTNESDDMFKDGCFDNIKYLKISYYYNDNDYFNRIILTLVNEKYESVQTNWNFILNDICTLKDSKRYDDLFDEINDNMFKFRYMNDNTESDYTESDIRMFI